MNETRKYNYEGLAEYNYKIVSFGHTEMIIICYSLAGTYAQVYKLDNHSIKHAMMDYHNFLQTKK